MTSDPTVTGWAAENVARAHLLLEGQHMLQLQRHLMMITLAKLV